MIVATVLFIAVSAYMAFLTAGYGMLLKRLTRGKSLARGEQTPEVS
ncbi:MAG: hypothetical protein HY801_00910, partial [Candidatus Lindowbacteria bacterium]|nr:hypothetical protein [Candidatus Lindowbacteria bacterium]